MRATQAAIIGKPVHPTVSAPRPWPLLGHLPAFYRDRLGFLDVCAQSETPVVPLRIGRPTLLLREPADIRFVLQEKPLSFEKTPALTSERGRRLSGNGVLTSSGDRHRKLRDTLQPLFTRSALAGFAPFIAETVLGITRAWRDDAVQNLAVEMPRLARCILARVLFDADYTAQDQALERAFLVRKQYLQYRFDYPFFWSEWAPIPLQVRYWKGRAWIDDYLKKRLERGRETPEGTHLLGRLIATGLDDQEICDEAITLAITGYETMADALMWALWMLAADQEAQTELRNEAHQVFGDGLPSAADVARLRFTSMVFSESLRLYPPTWLFLRHTVREERLPSGSRVAVGTKLYLSPWVVHRDPRFWTRPLCFRPDHFLEEEVARRPKLAYFPLGAGPRLCLGHHLAAMEGPLVLSLLAREFDFARVPNASVRPVGRMTLCAAGPVRVQTRPLR